MEINKIYNEDCLVTMSKMPNDFVDLTITSPPYDKLRDYKGYSFEFESIAKELYRVTKQGGVVVWVVNDSTKNGSETLTSFKQALFFKKIGFNVHDTMIYAKNSYMPLTHNRYEQQFEYMFVFTKKKPKIFNPIMIPSVTAGTKRNRDKSKANETAYSERKRTEKTIVNSKKQKPNIWFYDVGKNDKTKHNAPFPEQLVNDHIISWSNEGFLIYDPFMGSGTTAKMSIVNNRNWIGSEISSEYCEIINERINVVNQSLFPKQDREQLKKNNNLKLKHIKQQTAVEWLEDKIQSDMTFMEIMSLIRQAKEIENQQQKTDAVDWKTLEAREWAIGHKTMSRKLKNNLITNFNGVLLGDIQEGHFLKHSRVGYKSWQEFYELTRGKK